MTTATVPDAVRAYAVLDHIDEHPELLRIDSRQAQDLFRGDNSLDDLRRRVHDIFGPRPVECSGGAS